MNPIGKLTLVLGPVVVGLSYLVSSFWLAPLAEISRKPSSTVLSPREAAVGTAVFQRRAPTGFVRWTPPPSASAFEERGVEPVPNEDTAEATQLLQKAESAMTLRDYDAAMDAAEAILDLRPEETLHLSVRAEAILNQARRLIDEEPTEVDTLDAKQDNDR